MKPLFSLVLAMVLAAKCLAQDPTPGNCQLSSIIKIDGDAEEWPMTWIAVAEKKFSYNVCSDDNNIYIRMKTSDDMVKRKIALFGLTLWMDPNGKKKKKLGLKFPTGVEGHDRMEAARATYGDRKNMSSSERAEYQKEINRSFIKDLEVIELIGLSDDPLTSSRSGITNGLKVAIASDSSEAYVYEALIPFRSYRLSKSSISKFGVGFETGKLDQKPASAKASAAGVPTGGPRQAANGNRNFGTGGGGYSVGGGGYQSSPMNSSSSYWVSVKFK